jgi:hypothetical protein
MLRLTFIAAVLALMTGCGGGAPEVKLPKTEPVTGTVTLDEKPIAGAKVTFIPDGTTKGIECFGMTDESGKYKPQQLRGAEGVPAGTYKVTVSRLMRGGQPIIGEDKGAETGGVAIESLPPKYSMAAQTTLTATIKEGGGTHDIPLKSK